MYSKNIRKKQINTLTFRIKKSKNKQKKKEMVKKMQKIKAKNKRSGADLKEKKWDGLELQTLRLEPKGQILSKPGISQPPILYFSAN